MTYHHTTPNLCHCGNLELESPDAEYDTSTVRHTLTDCYVRVWPYDSLPPRASRLGRTR